MDEKTLQRQIIKYLSTAPNVWSLKTIASNRRGAPDVICCIAGRFVAFEIKAPGKLATLTPIQQHQIDQIRLNGGIAEAVDSLERVKSIVLSVDSPLSTL